jgi:hypothetical protein
MVFYDQQVRVRMTLIRDPSSKIHTIIKGEVESQEQRTSDYFHKSHFSLQFKVVNNLFFFF